MIMHFGAVQVLHIRNLPYETTHEELEELAAPFGTVQQSKLAVGPNRNQAFIEFESQSIAIAMVQYFASASEPAKVRRPMLLPMMMQTIQLWSHSSTACLVFTWRGVHTDAQLNTFQTDLPECP